MNDFDLRPDGAVAWSSGTLVKRVGRCEECGREAPVQSLYARAYWCVSQRPRFRSTPGTVFTPAGSIRERDLVYKLFCGRACARAWIRRRRKADGDTFLQHCFALGRRVIGFIIFLILCGLIRYLLARLMF
jgi:hypothetical protein